MEDAFITYNNGKYKLKEYKFEFFGQNLFLHPYRAMFWQEQNMLLLADVHLGKASHFRKAGIPVPDSVHTEDLHRIDFLLQYYRPLRLLILGDLFHSSYNNSWELVRNFFIQHFSGTPELILGNHDVLDPDNYSFLQVYQNPLIIHPFIFSHEPLDSDQCDNTYNICGHIHPGVVLRSPARQSLKAQCFYFGRNIGYMPAFGTFTGMSAGRQLRVGHDRIFVVSSNEIIPLN